VKIRVEEAVGFFRKTISSILFRLAQGFYVVLVKNGQTARPKKVFLAMSKFFDKLFSFPRRSNAKSSLDILQARADRHSCLCIDENYDEAKGVGHHELHAVRNGFAPNADLGHCNS
jgi:hypothetical protein